MLGYLAEVLENVEVMGCGSEPVDSAASSDPVEPIEPTDSAEAVAKISETAQVETVEETQVDATADVEKKPIPLGPISTDDAPGDEDGGPIAE